jgi:hypothetical protein
MSNKVVKKQGSEVSTELNSSWGTGQTIEARDILLPRAYVLQQMSELVTEEDSEFKSGQIIRSTNHEVLATSKEPVVFIPLYFNKKWQVSDMSSGTPKFLRFEKYDHTNADLPWDWEEGGKKYRRDSVLDFFCLLKSDIDAERGALKALEESGELPDPDDAMFPVCISFKRTSYSAGKVLLTHFSKAESFGVTPSCKMFNLKSKAVKGDQGTYYVLEVEVFPKGEGKTTRDDLVACKKWYDIISQANVRVDEEPQEAPKRQAAARKEPPVAKASEVVAPQPIEDIPF